MVLQYNYAFASFDKEEQAALKRIEKLYDPDSAVREGEVDLLMSLEPIFGKLKTLSEQYKVEETELTEKISIYKENEVDKKFAQFEQYSLEKRNNQIEIDKLKNIYGMFSHK